jgi:hypothetical protein
LLQAACGYFSLFAEFNQKVHHIEVMSAQSTRREFEFAVVGGGIAAAIAAEAGASPHIDPTSEESGTSVPQASSPATGEAHPVPTSTPPNLNFNRYDTGFSFVLVHGVDGTPEQFNSLIARCISRLVGDHSERIFASQYPRGLAPSKSAWEGLCLYDTTRAGKKVARVGLSLGGAVIVNTEGNSFRQLDSIDAEKTITLLLSTGYGNVAPFYEQWNEQFLAFVGSRISRGDRRRSHQIHGATDGIITPKRARQMARFLGLIDNEFLPDSSYAVEPQGAKSYEEIPTDHMGTVLSPRVDLHLENLLAA